MPTDAVSLLDTRGVDAGYGTMQVLWGVDLDVRPGETVLLLGANGAGKTTFLKSLVGLIEARSGHIKLGSEDITRMRSSDRMKRGMTYMSELAVFPDCRSRKISASARRRWAMPIRGRGSTNCTACSRCCATSAAIPRPACPAVSERCSASPRRCRPSRSCW
ncbi:ATP-binding cassette domain-containing protein [Bradyrhizobium brasilense]|uniref:ATP-binding cassette domain-containing protein n=1 Tax=Bradyrhizobium brasilense TaxID=1419277 RepID=A0ABY8JAT5_9BRAD|nr:ATP-binding cassette domain-containing protein [Bradyrhizobium brasilense]WFU61819.1 ATP-binding cassette domain-containing protein [Bradyrhizobium brasilense]